MREKDVEASLVRAVREKGGLCWKFTSPSVVGVPDRVVILPGRPAAFVEVKAPGRNVRPVQAIRAQQLRERGVKVFVVNDVSQIGGVLDEI
ncbi:VRR-NUC domain-containing protein [Schaalia sp. lx-100]|uniref:VRR-NUC domain-containing protein n=1 Tax=Schaalia sp. lx-100 TaxID=2899081 RepID=UPI001E328119|nr:VRR-NUC domain-containing protein [Schaalia sp. lx-100]MCD4557188.1 VRR-NUC domain-containing protein [Schaalia sp. lx-100]